MDKRIEEQARRVAEPFLLENGCRLWDVVFEKEGAMNYLRVLFDDGQNPDGDYALDMDKCERLTPPLNRLMDAQDFIKHVDILEIGSPGITRRLRLPEHFEACAGKHVMALARGDKGKTRTFGGTLAAYDRENKALTLQNKDESVTLSVKECIRITLQPEEEQ